MTFYEAALCVLQKEGRPLHVEELTKIVLESDLLSHVGKTPQEVMENRLAAMAKKPRDRRISITAPHTFGLVEWGLDEDRAALELPILDTYERNTGPLLRGRERDPAASPSKVRIAGRGERTRGLWREENPERRRHEKVKSLPEIIIEILSACKKPLTAVDLAAAARDRDVLSDDLGADALVHLLREENRKRSDMGKRPSFEFLATGEITLTALAQEDPHRDAADRPLTGARIAAMAAEQRRNIVRLLRRRLGELEGQSFDRVASALLERSGFSDLKIARRNRDGLVILGRRKEGLTELRYAVRVIRGTPDVSAQDVEEHSRSLGQFGSQMGIIVSAGEATREARQASQSSVPMVFLFCADALADACIDRGVGVAKTTIEYLDLDEEFFRRNGDPSKDDRDRRKAAGASSAGASDKQASGAPSRGDDRQAQGAAEGQGESGQPSKKSRREELREKRWQERQQRRQEQQAKAAAAAEAASKGNSETEAAPKPSEAEAAAAAAPCEALQAAQEDVPAPDAVSAAPEKAGSPEIVPQETSAEPPEAAAGTAEASPSAETERPEAAALPGSPKKSRAKGESGRRAGGKAPAPEATDAAKDTKTNEDGKAASPSEKQPSTAEAGAAAAPSADAAPRAEAGESAAAVSDNAALDSAQAGEP